MEGAAATYIHGDQAAEEVADDVRNGIKEMVLFEVLPATAKAIRWSNHNFPTIQNPELLEAEPAFWVVGEVIMKRLLKDILARTAVEAGDGHFPGVVLRIRQVGSAQRLS